MKGSVFMNTQDKIFANYNQRMGVDLLSASELEKANQLIRNVCIENYIPNCPPPCGQQTILEIGCGKGFLANVLHEFYPNGSILGVDLSPNDIIFAKEHFPEIEFRCENAFDILGENQYDLIIAKAIMEHIAKDRQEEFVCKLHKALKPGGVCIVHVPNMDWIFSNHERYMDFTHEIGYTRESLEDVFRLYFDDQLEIVPVSYIWPSKMSFYKKILFKYIRPIILYGCKLIFKFIGEGASDVWFYYRAIMAVARK